MTAIGRPADSLVVLARDANAIVVHLNRFKAIGFKAHIYDIDSTPDKAHSSAENTDGRSPSIKAVLDQLFDYRTEIDNNLSRLNLMDLPFAHSVVPESNENTQADEQNAQFELQ